MTIHKCQGLSLNCAIVDLSSKVFADGMAYVALSRVHSLDGLHLTAFDPRSVWVSPKCVEEINRLRAHYREDLPLYEVPKRSRKRLTGHCDEGEPPSKRPRRNTSKPKLPKESSKGSAGEKMGTSEKPNKKDLIEETPPSDPSASAFKFHCVDEDWQRHTCEALGLEFVGHNQMNTSSPSQPLMCPDSEHIRTIFGDGNCMFRALCHAVTGSQDQHSLIRAWIVQHMRDVGDPMIQHMRTCVNQCSDVEQYIERYHMDRDGVWGTEVELLAFAHLTKTRVFTYLISQKKWHCYGPGNVERCKRVGATAKSIYLRQLFDPEHYEVVLSVVGDSSSPGRSKANPPSRPSRVSVWPHYRFYYVDEQWQRVMCANLSLPFARPHRGCPGSQGRLLTAPDTNQLFHIMGDGSCLFRCFAHIITGSQRHHMLIRRALVEHLYEVESNLHQQNPNEEMVFNHHEPVTNQWGQPDIRYIPVRSVSKYLELSRMDQDGVYGTDEGISWPVHLINTPVYMFTSQNNEWNRYVPSMVDPSVLSPDVTSPALYMRHDAGRDHYEVVLGVLPIQL